MTKTKSYKPHPIVNNWSWTRNNSTTRHIWRSFFHQRIHTSCGNRVHCVAKLRLYIFCIFSSLFWWIFLPINNTLIICDLLSTALIYSQFIAILFYGFFQTFTICNHRYGVCRLLQLGPSTEDWGRGWGKLPRAPRRLEGGTLSLKNTKYTKMRHFWNEKFIIFLREWRKILSSSV